MILLELLVIWQFLDSMAFLLIMAAEYWLERAVNQPARRLPLRCWSTSVESLDLIDPPQITDGVALSKDLLGTFIFLEHYFI